MFSCFSTLHLHSAFMIHSSPARLLWVCLDGNTVTQRPLNQSSNLFYPCMQGGIQWLCERSKFCDSIWWWYQGLHASCSPPGCHLAQMAGLISWMRCRSVSFFAWGNSGSIKTLTGERRNKKNIHKRVKNQSTQLCGHLCIRTMQSELNLD